MFKKILQFILKILAQAVLKKYKPFVIGITGSVGKTSTKEAIYCVLRGRFDESKIRRNMKNYNNEIGAPLTILGCESAGKYLFGWLNIFGAAIGLILLKKKYPEVLILEMGADKPGDIKYLTNFIKCKIGVISAVGEIPVHVEFYTTSAQLAREKAVLAQSVSENGYVILNYDDEAVRKMREKTRAKILTFGFEQGADIRAFNFELHDIFSDDYRASFKIEYQGKTMPARLSGILGEHQVYSLLAGIAVGLVFNMNLIEIIGALENYQSPSGRMKLLKGIKNSWIIDDSYNASPVAMLGALETLESVKIQDGNRKIAVLGDMTELGQFTERAHRIVGGKAIKIADVIFTIGLRAKFIADEAKKHGFSEKDIFEFDRADDVKESLQNIIKEGDVVLVKGSQSMRMEKIIEEIMAEPSRADELLVRQEKDWKK